MARLYSPAPCCLSTRLLTKITTRIILLVFFTALSAAVSSPAQQCLDGKACNSTNSGGVIGADQQTGTDGCAKINASWSALPVTGGVVDAREMTGTQQCGSNPFDGVTKAGETLIGGATFETSTTWVMVDKSILQGIGRGDAGANNSVIQAVPDLSGPILHLSASALATEGIRAEDLTVDCNNNVNAIGVLDNAAQEESGLRHVLIVSCTNRALDIENGSQNSSYDDIEILSAGGSSATEPVVINTQGAFRGIHGITVNTWSTPYPNIAMHIGSMGSYTDMHCEGANVCFYVDADDVTLMNVECGPRVQTCVEIAPNVKNVTIMALYSTDGIMIENDADSDQLLTAGTDGHGVGWYSIGDSDPPAVCSSSSHVTCGFKMPDPPPQKITRGLDPPLRGGLRLP